MQIVINSISVPYQDKQQTKMDLVYSRDGKDANRKLVRIGDSINCFDVLRNAKVGEVYEIELVKKGEFWNWTKATKVESGATSTPAAKSTSTYETADERKMKQLMISRQSCIGYAVNYLNSHPQVDTTTNDILQIAQQFVDFVYDGLPDEKEVDDSF